MDTNELIKIAITAFVATCIKEVVSFLIKNWPRLAERLKMQAAPLFRRHLRLIPVLYDSLVIVVGYCFIISSINDKSPASKGFSALCAFMAILIVMSLREIPDDIANYIKKLRENKPIPSTAILTTEK